MTICYFCSFCSSPEALKILPGFDDLHVPPLSQNAHSRANAVVWARRLARGPCIMTHHEMGLTERHEMGK